MSKSLIILLSIVAFACNKKDLNPYSGVDIIDNKLYGTQSYYALGFSFELGKKTSTLEVPAPDITIHVSTDVGGNITGKYINSPNLIESFALAGSFNSITEADDFFNSLTEVGNRIWSLNAQNVEENDVWLFKTSEGNYVKFRIVELITDNAVNPPFVQMKFEWRLQPDGSTTFGSK